LFLIDIAVPRDIAANVQELENVYLYNIDNLEQLMRENVRVREQEVAACRGIIEKHVVELMAKLEAGAQKPKETPKTEFTSSWAFQSSMADYGK
jgi:glutamyl-tRNA reductase